MKRIVMFALAGILGLGVAVVVPPSVGPFGSAAFANTDDQGTKKTAKKTPKKKTDKKKKTST